MDATTTLNAVFTIGSHIWEHVNYAAPFALLIVAGIGIVVLQGIVTALTRALGNGGG